jgi:epoxyqueuosine reductase QueG
MPVAALLDRTKLSALCLQAGADDVAFVEIGRDVLAPCRQSILQVLPWAQSFMVFVRRLNSYPIRTSVRSLASAEFAEGIRDLKTIVHRLTRDLEADGICAVGLTGLFPMEFERTDGPPFIVPLKYLAEASGLGLMGKNRMALHPRFGAYMYIGAIALDGTVDSYHQPLQQSPCIDCNLCAAACPTGAIAKDGHFDFTSCMTHNYREKVDGFVEWIHTIADSRNRRDYRRRVSDVETLSWWQSLAYDANTHCDYCIAVCPAGDEAVSYTKDPAAHYDQVVQPLRDREEAVYVVPGSDAEAYVAENFPHKAIRRIGSGRAPRSIAGMLRMLPLVFQRGRSKGLTARYHFLFRGKEKLEASVEIHDQQITVERGLHGKADLIVRADSAAWLGFVAKERNLAWEMLCGRIRVKGPGRLMQAFGRCFPS